MAQDTDRDGLTDAWERGVGRYEVVLGNFTWETARTDAERKGGHLATVIHAGEWADLKTVLGSKLDGKNLWLGGTDDGTEGEWRWVTGEKWMFDHWRTGEPGNDSLGNGQGSPENYLMIWGHETESQDGRQAFWNDATVGGGVLVRDGYILERGSWTDPLDPDTDDDGLSDREELEPIHGVSPSDPNNADTDADGFKDGDEVRYYKTNPTKADSDGDGLSDFDEVRRWQTDPTVADSDGDGLRDGDEVVRYRTDPNRVDSDGDGAPDGTEIEFGSDPNVVTSLPSVPLQIQKALELEIKTEPRRRYELQTLNSDGTWIGVETFVGDGSTLTRLISNRINPPRQWRVGLSTNQLPSEMIWIPPGTFVMGSPDSERERDGNETQHTVILTRGFWMGQHEVTQGEYLSVMDKNLSYFKNGVDALPPGVGGKVTNDLRHPVERVSWMDATNYCAKLTERDRANGMIPLDHIYRLPTEAEWEYACRAGTTTAFHFGTFIRQGMASFYTLTEYESSVGTQYRTAEGLIYRTMEVGSFAPNAFGLYDMHGSVWEWCSDWYGEYPNGDVINPEGTTSGRGRVIRGGSWYYFGRDCRAAGRNYFGPGLRSYDIGFRVVLAPVR